MKTHHTRVIAIVLKLYCDDDPRLVGNVDYPHIIFRKDDGTCGMKVRLEEIVDVWLKTLEPELQQKLELDEITRSEKRELAKLRKKNERRDDDDRMREVQRMLKPFLREQILNVLSKRGLKITKLNIRNLIAECKQHPDYHPRRYKYNPMGILFTKKEWDEFRDKCNKIWKRGVLHPVPNIDPSGYYDNYNEAISYIIDKLTELRNRPISFWK